MYRPLPLSRINASTDYNWNLDDTEVEVRRMQYGTNDILEKSSNRWLELLKDTLQDTMLWFLLITGCLFLLLGNEIEAIILFAAIVPIAGMDAFLHWRTEVSTRSLSQRLLTYAKVIRHGVEKEILSREIVPGDLVVVDAGSYFPADGIIVQGNNLQVDESSLTGESFPVAKKTLNAISAKVAEPAIDYQYWGMVGTRLLTGRALMRVVYTGKETLYGEIIASVINTTIAKTPLQIAIAKLIYILIFIATTFCFILAGVRYYQGFGVIDALLSAATLAVAALPDEFPVVFTFFLALGVYRLAQRHALVKRAVSVENIGRVTCICTDKTGTITLGEFQVTEILPAAAYSAQDLLLTAMRASRQESGDPLDLAIMTSAEKYNLHNAPPLNVFPFTEERKRETAIYKDKNIFFAATKGAPETILSLCDLSTTELNNYKELISQLAQKGYKLLACARYTYHDSSLDFPEPEKNYQFLGILAFEDPPRRDVFAAVKQCQQRNIHIVMLTGDHPDTARRIATDIGISNGNPMVMMADMVIEKIKTEGGYFLHQVDVIARAIPSQKLAIVNALQAAGDIVAVTGDGVNDVPALRAADIGIAMGERGTQSARESADIVLMDDNFGSIVNAIAEGIQLFKNLRLSFKYLLMVHIPFIVSAAIIPLLGYPLLYYPIHIVLVELFIHPTSLLVFQNLPQMKEFKHTEKRRTQFFSQRDWWFIAIAGIYTTCLIVLSYIIYLHTYNDEQTARAMAFAGLVITHIALTLGLSQLKNLPAKIIIVASTAILLLAIQLPWIAAFFQMAPLGLNAWLSLMFCSVVTLGLARVS